MTALVRFLFVIPIAFVFSCFAAGFAMLWPFIDTAGAAAGDAAFWVQAALGILAQTAQVGASALTPWALFMVSTEILGWRSIILHMLAGIAGGYGVMRAAYGEAMPHGSVQTAMIVSGLTFALVYWIVAGRNAGRWKRPMRPAAKPQTPPATATQTVETGPQP